MFDWIATNVWNALTVFLFSNIWYVAGAIAIVLLLTSQWWLPLFKMLPKPVQWILGGFIWSVLVGMYYYGRGQKHQQALQRQREERAEHTRKTVDKEVLALPPDELKKEVDKWNRDTPGSASPDEPEDEEDESEENVVQLRRPGSSQPVSSSSDAALQPAAASGPSRRPSKTVSRKGRNSKS